MTLVGWTLPQSATGRASILPSPPWHYSGEVIAVDFQADPTRVAELVPAGFEPAADGGCSFVFCDWSSAADHDPRIKADPAKGQYKEAYVVLHGSFDGKRAGRVPYIWVDSDLSLVRGLIQGFPKKLGQIAMTRPVELGHGGARKEAGEVFAGHVSVHGRRIVTLEVTLDEVRDKTYPKGVAAPLVHTRLWPSIDGEEPAVRELSRGTITGFEVGPVWHGGAQLELGASEHEEIDALAPVVVGDGWVLSMAFSVTGGTAIPLDGQGMSPASVLEGERRELRRVLVGGSAHWATVEGDTLVLGDGRTLDEATATYLAPADPSKILCVHLNYESRRLEFESPELVTPTYFQKPLTTLNAHRGVLCRPDGTHYLNYEGEIAAVVGRPMRNVAPDDVWSHLAGFACSNDVGLHDFRDTDAGSMLRVKGQDGFCPIGPGLVSGVDVRGSELRTYVNGEVVQSAPVAEMNFGIDYLLADLCRHITLVPGDVVLTGTPANSRPLEPGDLVEVEVTGLGRLTNTVVSVPAPPHGVGHQPTDSKQVRAVALGSDYRRLRDAARASGNAGP